MAPREAQFSVGQCSRLLGKCYRRAAPLMRTEGTRVPYWWTPEISKKRQDCLKARRTLLRCHKRNNPVAGSAAHMEETYKAKKKELRLEIRASKRRCWDILCSDIDNNEWGDGYKLALKTLSSGPPGKLRVERKAEAVASLFPQHPIWRWQKQPTTPPPPFTLKELEEAGLKMRAKKAPGPDGLPPEVIKEAIRGAPEYILRILNKTLVEGNFPDKWKLAK